VSLSWDASSSSSIAGYRVYRSTSAGTGFVPLTAIIADLTYVDSTVAASNTYYYVVTAVDSVGVESPYSNEVTAIIP
jgi:bacillopeptidase F